MMHHYSYFENSSVHDLSKARLNQINVMKHSDGSRCKGLVSSSDNDIYQSIVLCTMKQEMTERKKIIKNGREKERKNTTTG